MAIVEERAVLVDFGVARIENLRKLTMTGLFVGTLFYAAPEQLIGDDVMGAADVYSTGVMLYEMLSGKLPHEDESDHGLFRKIANDSPAPMGDLRPELPELLAKATDRMLLKSPGDRPTAAEARELLREAGDNMT